MQNYHGWKPGDVSHASFHNAECEVARQWPGQNQKLIFRETDKYGGISGGLFRTKSAVAYLGAVFGPRRNIHFTSQTFLAALLARQDPALRPWDATRGYPGEGPPLNPEARSWPWLSPAAQHWYPGRPWPASAAAPTQPRSAAGWAGLRRHEWQARACRCAPGPITS